MGSKRKVVGYNLETGERRMWDTMSACAETIGTSVSYMIKEYAQVQAIRAWVYMQLLYAYGENRVPFYTEPMLNTDDINAFMADKNHPLLNADVLAKELGPKLEEVEAVEYPQPEAILPIAVHVPFDPIPDMLPIEGVRIMPHGFRVAEHQKQCLIIIRVHFPKQQSFRFQNHSLLSLSHCSHTPCLPGRSCFILISPPARKPG